MTRVHQASMINQHHNRSSDLCHKKSLYPCLFPITCFSNHHKLYTIWKLKISKFILWKPFWNRTLRCHRNGTSKCFGGLLPLSGGVILQNVLRSFRNKTFIILTKYISLERSESQDSIFGGYFVIDVILREKLIDLWQNCIKKIIQWSFNGTRWLFLV